MDWQLKGEEKLENLPRRESNHDYSWENGKYRGSNLPYHRITRWLESKIGEHIDTVISEYVHAQWVPKQFRFAHEVGRFVELNTFWCQSKICYHDNWNNEAKRIDESGSKTFYVHPGTKMLCLYIPPTRESYQKIRQRELAKRVKILGPYHQCCKIDGIWFELKAQPEPVHALEYGLDRKSPTDCLLEEDDKWYFECGKNPYVRIVSKRQLNSKELKKHGLKNGPFFLRPKQTARNLLGI